MQIPVELHRVQEQRWPRTGRHILAHHDAETVVVYQAYRESIARHAVEHQSFGGEFSYSRMSWIKPNFLWMMYRCGWGTKEGQERVLAITLPRSFFDELLAAAVPSSYTDALYPDHEAWQNAVARSDVRLQWDPDHGPTGAPLERRAIQLGLRGEFLRRYGREELIAIADASKFVEEQRVHASGGSAELVTPVEDVYRPESADAWRAVGLDTLR